MVHFPRFARLQDEADAGAGTVADQVVVQARDGEQSGDRGVVLVDGAIAQNNQTAAVGNGLIRRHKDRVQRGF